MGLASALVAGLARLRDGFVQHGRLSALALLAEPTMAGQEARAREAVRRIEQAARVHDHLQRYFSARSPAIGWPRGQRPEQLGLVPPSGVAALPPIEAEQARLVGQLGAMVVKLDSLCVKSLLAQPASLLLGELARTLPVQATSAANAAPAMRRAPVRVAPSAVRVMRGPRRVALDPLFEPAFSLLDRPDLLLASGGEDEAPFYWLAGLRESMASQLCALSLVEYDGLPLAFYRDFAKQAWDEMRHARFFLQLGVELLPAFVRTAKRSHPLLPGARRYLREGRGLPCPVERNLYEVAWNATLPQRLVLMHLDTETPGIARFKEELKAGVFRARPLHAEGLRLSTHDEATHARLGRTWLLHLFPERAERRAEIARTRLLRGALLVAAFSHYHRRPMAELIRAVAKAGRAA